MAAVASKSQAAREMLDIVTELSFLLNTHLDRRTLTLCISLIENGINPDALATVVTELRRESEKVQQAPNDSGSR